MPQSDRQTFASGVNQSGLRDYNERLLLSTIQKLGPTAGGALARSTNLSAQTVSVILRNLERDGLLLRGNPVRGRVGKPSIPMSLNPDGAFSFGLKIGRTSVDLALMDFHGQIRSQRSLSYALPHPDQIFAFLEAGIAQMTEELPAALRGRIGSIGLAVPFDIWNWHETLSATWAEMAPWRDISHADEIGRFSDLPVTILNDMTSACHAENALGAGRDLTDFAYFFLGAFVGGGIVLNRKVYEGRMGNAGALGSLPSASPGGTASQLLDRVSLYLLAASIKRQGGDAAVLQNPDDWRPVMDHVIPWIDSCARELAFAALSVCAVIDFEAVVIDGAIPRDVLALLASGMRAQMNGMNARGLSLPRIVEGKVGANARVMGAAYGPLQDRHFMQSGPFSSVEPESAG